jgi:6-phosphofructokinase 1
MTAKRLGVVTSGGDAPGMNAALRAITRRAILSGWQVFGFRHGFSGLMRGEYQKMHLGTVADVIHRGGTILRTSRTPEFATSEGLTMALKTLEQLGVEHLIVIGGDGSCRGSLSLKTAGVKVIHIPSTIDNNLIGTDYCIGHLTAVDTAVQAINRIRDTATSHERIFIVETMGRDTGFIALEAGLASGAESIIIPEVPVDIEKDVCSRIVMAREKGKAHSIIVVAEGCGPVTDVAKTITELTGLEARLTILGHVQRGGSPLAIDRYIATRMGAAAVDFFQKGIHGVQVGLVANNLVTTSLELAAFAKRQIDIETFRLAHALAL